MSSPSDPDSLVVRRQGQRRGPAGTARAAPTWTRHRYRVPADDCPCTVRAWRTGGYLRHPRGALTDRGVRCACAPSTGGVTRIAPVTTSTCSMRPGCPAQGPAADPVHLWQWRQPAVPDGRQQRLLPAAGTTQWQVRGRAGRTDRGGCRQREDPASHHAPMYRCHRVKQPQRSAWSEAGGGVVPAPQVGHLRWGQRFPECQFLVLVGEHLP